MELLIACRDYVILSVRNKLLKAARAATVPSALENPRRAPCSRSLTSRQDAQPWQNSSTAIRLDSAPVLSFGDAHNPHMIDLSNVQSDN